MQSGERFWRGIAAVGGLLAIGMGAVASHAIAEPHMAALAEKASLYQLVHSLVLLWLAERQGRCFWLARWVFLAAIVLFCGTLYLKALCGWMAATAFAPLGGVCFMLGWLLIALAKRT